MTNTANIRFEPSNVAYVTVDLETHEMTGGVMDETTGTFYPVGGGGDPRLVIPAQTISQTNETPYAILSNIPDNITDYDLICLLLADNFTNFVLAWDADNSEYSGTEYKFSMKASLTLESDQWKLSILNPDETPITGDLPILGIGLTESE